MSEKFRKSNSKIKTNFWQKKMMPISGPWENW